MFLAVCPFCGHDQECLGAPGGRVIICRQCQDDYEAETAAVAERGPVAAKLTSPHFCQHCRYPIHLSVGRREWTLPCPDCQCKTSIYAVVYHCPGCQAMLESPANLLTRTAPRLTYLHDDDAPPSLRQRSEKCPACARSVVVPFDVAVVRSKRALEEDEFQFSCPSCRASLEALKQHAGMRIVCPACLYIITVSRYGEAQAAVTTHAADPREAIARSADYACPHCANHIPVRAAVCPVCSRKV